MAAYVECTSKTPTSLTVRLSGMDVTYDGNPRTCKWYLVGLLKHTVQLANKISQSPSYTFTGLSPNSTYLIDAVVSASGWADEFTFSGTFQTKEVLIEKFEWSSKAKKAFNGNGATTNLTATEWNELVAKVKEIIPGWNSNSAKADPGDPISAAKFNAIASQVGYDTVEPGWICYGSYFIELANAVNSLIGG